MTVEKQLIDKVESIRTTLNEISVYNLDVKTSLELYYELARKVNEVITELSRFEGVVSDEVVKQNEKLLYLLGEGLKDQVGIKIDELITNGTIQDLINNKLFNDLNTKIETYKQQTDEQFNTIEGELVYKSTKSKGNNKKTMITFVSDDGQIQDYTVLKDIFAKHGVPCVTAVSGSRVGTNNFCNKQQLLELQNNYKWEICSHTYSHKHLTELTDEEIDNEIKLNYNYLVENSFNGNKTICIPYNYYDDRVLKIVAKYHDVCRVSWAGFNQMPIQTYSLKSNWITEGESIDDITGLSRNTLDHFKKLIDMAVENKSWLVIATHSWEVEQWGCQLLLDNIISYAKSKAEIVTFREGIEYYKNSVEQVTFDKKKIYADRFIIGQDGTVNSNVARTKVVAPLTFDYNSKPSDFDKDYVIYTPILGSQASNFPERRAGLLITHSFTQNNTDDYAFTYQEYHVYGKNSYYRRTVLEDNSWGNWESIGIKENIIECSYDNTKNENNTLTDFEENSITYTFISTSNATNLPTKKGGTLITYRFSNDYSYQIYKPVRSTTSYKRNFVENVWTTWSIEGNVSIEPINNCNGETKPSAFLQGITYNTLSYAHIATSTGLPVREGGILTTHILGVSGYNYQTFRAYGKTSTWMRSQLESTDAWGEWKQISTEVGA